MPIGVYKRNKKILRYLKKIGIRKGEHISQKTEFKKGFIPWNKGRCGYKLSEKHKNKISLGLKKAYLKKIRKPENYSYKISLSLNGRKLSESHYKKITSVLMSYIENHKGDKHYNWKGGISNLPYTFDFNEDLKNKIKIKDNYVCQICKITEEEHLIVYGVALYIHHIDYNKSNTDETNLISLCAQCHTRTNYNRDYWIEFFKKKENIWQNTYFKRKKRHKSQNP